MVWPRDAFHPNITHFVQKDCPAGPLQQMYWVKLPEECGVSSIKVTFSKLGHLYFHSIFYEESFFTIAVVIWTRFGVETLTGRSKMTLVSEIRTTDNLIGKRRDVTPGGTLGRNGIARAGEFSHGRTPPQDGGPHRCAQRLWGPYAGKTSSPWRAACQLDPSRDTSVVPRKCSKYDVFRFGRCAAR